MCWVWVTGHRSQVTGHRSQVTGSGVAGSAQEMGNRTGQWHAAGVIEQLFFFLLLPEMVVHMCDQTREWLDTDMQYPMLDSWTLTCDIQCRIVGH
jgi:hypothetical protein